MTKVSYIVRKSGVRGCAKAQTLADAKAKASEIKGTYRAIYSEVVSTEMTEKDMMLREKRIEHFKNRG